MSAAFQPWFHLVRNPLIDCLALPGALVFLSPASGHVALFPELPHRTVRGEHGALVEPIDARGI
ncbi:MAG: hypothetical protein ABIQ16_28070, partial [Polyangiaceae bacterium]